MGLLAKLISLTAIQTRDPSGTDKLVISRVGGGEFDGTSMSTGDEFDFDDQKLIPFDQQLELALTEVDSESHQPQNLGAVFIRADEQNRGELTQQFRGAGALYDLKYKVI